MDQSLICTIGHSNRSLEVFVELLRSNEIARVLDVRTVPRSARNPQFNRETLPDALSAHGVGYTHLPGLGGLRKPRADSPNAGWNNLSFRGYADYMDSPEFVESVDFVAGLAASECCALMCAEAVPWRCHRSLVADALNARGVRVEHILGPGKRRPHTMTSFARVDGLKITYPGGAHG